MDFAESTLITFNCKFHLANSEWYRLHYSLLTIVAKLDVINELRENLWVRLRQVK